MKNTNFLNNGKETWEQLKEIHRFGYSSATIFSDFVDFCLFPLLSLTENLQYVDVIDRVLKNKLTGEYEEKYLELVNKYSENKTMERGKRPIDYIANAWGLLQKETHEYGQDILGEIYMNQISLGEHGQFFTPVPLSDMMASITGAEGKTMSDPACGSGRFFISMNKQNKNMHCYGVDLSPICAKMTALNMWLFDINADIYQGNSLTMQMFQLWKIRKGGFIYHENVEGKIAPMPEAVKKKIQQSLFD